MNKKCSKILIIVSLIILFCSGTLTASELGKSNKGQFYLQTSLMTAHWDNDPDTNNIQELIGLEYYVSNSDLYGLAYFKNSAFQPSWYFYKGKIYPWKKINDFKLYGKLTYGIITGYDDEDGRYDAAWYELGTFPALLPSAGVKYNSFSLEISLFANQGFIVHGGVKF
ncbi:MAG: hypothetical protein ACQERJ_00715 [Bacillota bacterium]